MSKWEYACAIASDELKVMTINNEKIGSIPLFGNQKGPKALT
jgi:hypothetical protein